MWLAGAEVYPAPAAPLSAEEVTAVVCAAPDERSTDIEAGVSLVEIVVAMFLLALMSVAVLPLMIGSVQASATNRDVVAASSLANAELASLQATFPNSAETSCADVSAAAVTGVADPSGSGATASISVGPCPTSFPGTVLVKVQSFRRGSTTPVVVLDSAILVTTP